ncbi:guanine nucleotide-binding protein G(o) subunit alpha [Biomphalaria pfeifferi]|uniref:Guanine nucleotide-binding protein G(O) subunit alpha n=1 Tax=Biomphalaria pfeifferi TaxID=112525 RepID=A0AAD8F4B5_BIOPF|nr:guanine nucleotide-binding protein G(o) subunit alpha [Biomphalaria pfeifferi]
MGVNISAHDMEQAARRRSKTIDDGLEAERIRQARTVKVLMLGLSGAGKSTLAKQVRMIHEKGFADKEKALYREIVRQNIVTAILGVLHEMEIHGIQFPTEELKQTANSIKDRLKSSDSHKAVVDMRHSLAVLTSQKTLKDFMDTYLDVEICQLNHYLFRSLEKILSDSYAPTDYDILRVRQKTTGLNEILFHFKGFEFKLCDVDGHCTVKKKWLQNFENVSAILFTVALSSYDARSKDQDEQTELHDALSVFTTVSEYDGFRKSPIILFLNKKDIFQQKLKKVPLTVAFPDYKGTNEFNEACLFVQSKFESCMGDTTDRLTVHITNATDTPSIRSVFDSSLAVVLDQA